ncbi:hypothetical protein [Burkholderia gladioli]|uniref:hypothetical protein n=1 Tax=Burkholderia gladioli TaxID=28095 RepID=UPI00163FFB95|nr:hypothetical protein [Burkholderia gladioli]
MSNPDRSTGLTRQLGRRSRRTKIQRDTASPKKRFLTDHQLEVVVIEHKGGTLSRKDASSYSIARQVRQAGERLANLEAQMANIQRFGVLEMLPALLTCQPLPSTTAAAPARRRHLSGPLDPSLMTVDYSEPEEQSEQARETLYERFGVRPQR